jgi:YD repeat-containing protein
LDPPLNAAEAAQLAQETTDPGLNQVTTYEYDALGRRFKTTLNAGESFAQTALTVYDALGRVVRTITNFDGTGVTHPFTADRSTFTHGTDNTKNLITDTAFNERGLVRKQVDVAGNVTLYGYDAAGRLVKTIQSASEPDYNNDYSGTTPDPDLSAYVADDGADKDLVSLNEYDANGNLVKSTNGLGRVTLLGVDALNRIVTPFAAPASRLMT